MTMSDAEKGSFISKVTSKMIGDKKRWRAYKARKRQLPGNYAAAVEAIERYLMYFVPADGVSVESEFEDLADLFEQAALDGTPVREIVGENPEEFVETFARNYSRGGYVPPRVRKQLTDAIARAEEEGPR
jgi:DNA-binding ferritin-like protein (Dps family)